MNLRSPLLLAGCLASLSLLAACGEDSTDEEPVASTPLRGTIDGREFVPVSALATEGFEAGEKWIEISDSARDCGDFSVPATGARSILITKPWTPGSSQLSLQNNLTFVIQEADGPSNHVVISGRLELIETPTAVGSTGLLRLRAIDGQDKVEGEMSVKVCE